MIRLIVDRAKKDLSWIEFSDGAKTVKIADMPKYTQVACITVDPKTPVALIREEVDLVLSAIYHSAPDADSLPSIYLNIPYLPYARADRVFETGMAHPLDMFLEWLDYKNFTQIFVDDIHNIGYIQENYPDLPIVLSEQHEIAYIAARKERPDYILAPDKGAYNKALQLSLKMKIPLITATKVRDVTTGKILSVELDMVPEKNSSVFIVDDIMDGGGTFIPLAKTLKELDCRVSLFVTHLIAKNGLDVLEDINALYYHNIIGSYVYPDQVVAFNEK